MKQTIRKIVLNAARKAYENGVLVSDQIPEMEIEEPRTRAIRDIGIDLGINKFVATSNDDYIDSIHVFRKYERKLIKEQRKLSRKIRYSNNYKKQKKKAQQIHSKITNIRYDFLQKESTRLSKSHALIVVESLKIKNISKSSKGDIEKPGRNVKVIAVSSNIDPNYRCSHNV